uniref:Thioredoxin-like fold domain-containing protein n=1 Tax=Polytomella parva TaxID=51329 RepID=A0A7S0YM27_9CHLO
MSDATSSSTTATRVHLDDAVSLDESGRLSDYGKPVLSDVQRQYKHTMRTPNPNTPAVNYQLRRTHLPRLDIDRTGKWQARVLGESAPVDTVVLLCVLAGYDPLCSRVEPQLEMTWFEIVEATAATPSADLAHVVMWRVEASQDRILQEMYRFRSVPMFLMFYEGAMVWGGNTIRSAEDVRRVALEALIRGRRKDAEGTAMKGGLGGGVNDSTILEGVIDEEALAKKVRGISM